MTRARAICVFCGAPGASDEHVFALWITNLLKDAAPFTLNRFPGRSKNVLRTINLKSRAPCKRCNNDWMSRFEEEAKPLLVPIFSGQAARWNPDEQLKVARWTFKTALMLDRSSEASRVAPAEHFSYLYRAQAPPKSAVIYLAQYFPDEGESSSNLVLGSSFRPTGVETHLYPNPYQITFNVGQAIFQVFGHSGTAALQIRRAGYRDSGLLVPVTDVFRQLWPLSGGVYEWPPQGGYLGAHNLKVLARF